MAPQAQRLSCGGKVRAGMLFKVQGTCGVAVSYPTVCWGRKEVVYKKRKGKKERKKGRKEGRGGRKEGRKE